MSAYPEDNSASGRSHAAAMGNGPNGSDGAGMYHSPGTEQRMTTYDFFKDQGAAIGGVLAFVAGLLIYLVGRAQVNAVDRQNAELKHAERRRFARSGLIAARLIEGILSGIGEDVDREFKYARNLQSQTPDANLVLAMWMRIKLPDIALVWDQLGALDQEIITNYMRLTRCLAKLQHPDFLSPTVAILVDNNQMINQMLNDLQRMQALIESLQGFLNSEFERANSILSG